MNLRDRRGSVLAIVMLTSSVVAAGMLVTGPRSSAARSALGAVAIATPRGASAADPVLGPAGSIVIGGHYGALSINVTFESLNLAPNTQIDVPDGVSTTVDGYTFTPGPNNNSGFNDSHFGNAVFFWNSNGTTVMNNHDDVIMTKAGGGSFSLVAFDFSGWPVNYETQFTVTGQPGNVTQTFTPDGIVDGPGGEVDFQTFVLPPSFANVTSVTWEHSGPGALAGIFSLDNIVTDLPTSAGSTSWSRIKRLFR